MGNQDWSDLGKEIRDAVNEAIEHGNFSGVNDLLSHTLDGSVKDLAARFHNAWSHSEDRQSSSSTWNRSDNKVQYSRGKKIIITSKPLNVSDLARNKSMYEAKDERYKRNSVSALAILSIVFGSIFLAGFGIPALVSLAVGIGAAAFGTFQRLGLFFFLPLSAFSAYFMAKGIRAIEKRSRFKKYVKTIGSRSICAIKTLSRAVGKTEKFVLKDVSEMIGEGLFLQGHIDDENTCLMLTDETYDMYLKAKERSRQQMEEKEREERMNADRSKNEQKKNESPEFQNALEEGRKCMEIIRQVNDELPEPVISQKLDQLEKTIGLIYIRLQKCPEQISSMKRFTDYYLPTTIKLVRAYREFEHTELESERVSESKREIENALDTINAAYKQMLESLYEEDTMDILSDIQVLQTLLAQEGYVDDGLRMNSQ